MICIYLVFQDGWGNFNSLERGMRSFDYKVMDADLAIRVLGLNGLFDQSNISYHPHIPIPND